MFRKTFQTSLKTIIRSPLVWGAIFLVLAVGIFHQLQVHYSYFDSSSLKSYADTDPEFNMSFKIYINEVLNTPLGMALMLFSVPAFCVIVSGVVLVRDWRDGFFEVDRAGGVSARKYFFGRYFAVLSFVAIVALAADFIFFHSFFIARKGVESWDLWRYLTDSTVRILRVFFTSVLPGIFIFVSVPFLFGNLMKSGVAGMISGLSYVVFAFALRSYLGFRAPDFVKNYLFPAPNNLYQYWAFYGTDRFYDIMCNPLSTGEMLACILSLYATAAVCAAISFICVKRRKV